MSIIFLVAMPLLLLALPNPDLFTRSQTIGDQPCFVITARNLVIPLKYVTRFMATLVSHRVEEGEDTITYLVEGHTTPGLSRLYKTYKQIRLRCRLQYCQV